MLKFIYMNSFSINNIMVVRSILALSTLLTIILSDIEVLVPEYNIERIKNAAFGIENLNIFLHFENIYLPYTFSIIVLVVVILGIYPILFSILHFVVIFSVYQSILVNEGGDQINLILTLLIIPFCFSNKLFFGYNLKFITVTFFKKSTLFIIRLQVSFLYFQSAVEKAYQKQWNNGSAMYYWLNDYQFGLMII